MGRSVAVETMRALWLSALLVGCGVGAPTLSTPLPPLDDIVRTCAFEVSCLHDPPAAVLHNCVAFFIAGLRGSGSPFVPGVTAAEYKRYVGCATGASDCTTALRCASRNHDPTYCGAHPGYGCDGDLLVECAAAGATPDWAIYTTDCAALGLHCAPSNGSASCTDGTSCDHRSFFDHCDGNVAVKCDPTTDLRSTVDCGLWPDANTRCQQGSAVGCFPIGPPCQSVDARCDGDFLVSCNAFKEEERFDCAQLASHCGVVSGGGSGCVPIASECTVGSADQCSGGSITTCVGGTVRTVDCAAIGLSTCTIAAGGEPICG